MAGENRTGRVRHHSYIHVFSPHMVSLVLETPGEKCGPRER